MISNVHVMIINIFSPIRTSLTPHCRYSGYPAGLVEGMESDAGTAVCSDSCFGPRRPAT